MAEQITAADAKFRNASHLSCRGCGMNALKSTVGTGLLYCFAAD
jgi:hypothetical protein